MFWRCGFTSRPRCSVCLIGSLGGSNTPHGLRSSCASGKGSGRGGFRTSLAPLRRRVWPGSRPSGPCTSVAVRAVVEEMPWTAVDFWKRCAACACAARPVRIRIRSREWTTTFRLHCSRLLSYRLPNVTSRTDLSTKRRASITQDERLASLAMITEPRAGVTIPEFQRGIDIGQDKCSMFQLI